MTKFPQGVRVFAPKENAPSFVKGQLIINPKEYKGLNAVCNELAGTTGLSAIPALREVED